MVQWELMTDQSRKDYFQTLLNRLPVFRNGFVKVYCPDIPFNEFPTGRNHITHAQVYHHSIYFYLMSKLGLQDVQLCNALRLFMHRRMGLISGYKFDIRTHNIVHSDEPCNPDYLSAVTLAVMQTTDDVVLEEFEQCIAGIVDNHYGFRSDTGQILPHYKYNHNSIHLLAALSHFAPKSKSLNEAYNDLFYKKLGFLFSLSLDNIPDYIAAYILSKNTKGLMKVYWKAVLKINYHFSGFKFNGFVSGLIEEIFPNTLDTLRKGWITRELFYGGDPEWYDKYNKRRKGLAWLSNFVSIDVEQCKSLMGNKK